IATAIERFGGLDFLVNNTGINPTYGPMIEMDLGAARKIFEVNVLAAVSWAQKAHAASLKDNGGAIVNIASVAGLKPAPMIGMYGASKSAVIHVTQELSLELAPQVRSEEHTSELQSRENLVCRLLLEKKKTNKA